MKKLMLALAGAVTIAMMATGGAYAQKKELAIVVKGLDNPFFSAMGAGCEKWNTDNPDSEYFCTYNGPAVASDEAGELQIVQDLITKGVAGIAISPSNAPAMGNLLRQIKPTIPVIAIDAEFTPTDAAELTKLFFGTDNYAMGVQMAEWAIKLKPNGANVCIQEGNPAAANLKLRANGFRDTITGVKDTQRLAGEKGWTEVDGCPHITNDSPELANQQIADSMVAHPEIDAWILTGGWSQFAPQAYTQNFEPIKDKIISGANPGGSIFIVAGDVTDSQRPLFRAGLSSVQVGQRPSEMGNRAPDLLIQLINGETLPTVINTGLDVCSPDDVGICAN